jgi:hypothetical protein
MYLKSDLLVWKNEIIIIVKKFITRRYEEDLVICSIKENRKWYNMGSYLRKGDDL